VEDLNTLNDLFESELQDVYNAEQQVMQAMPKMIDAASDTKLRDKLQRHMMETEKQIRRLDDIFDMLDMEPEAEVCEGMAGIIRDGEKVIQAKGDPMVKDAALIAGAQKVEHYEITSYGTLRSLAQTLGMDDIALKLERTLKEEFKTDELLTGVAERGVNKKAPRE